MKGNGQLLEVFCATYLTLSSLFAPEVMAVNLLCVEKRTTSLGSAEYAVHSQLFHLGIRSLLPPSSHCIYESAK